MILLDTHVLIWWLDQSPKLSKKAKKIIDKEIKTGTILLSTITTWELSLLTRKGKIKLSKDIESWIGELEKLPFIQFVSLDNKIVLESNNLPGDFHEDPADRFIVATARQLGAALVTSDLRIREYPQVMSIW